MDEADQYDVDGGGQGAKHWTDEEKTKLFTYLMGRGQDDHWQSLKATKNSCLREVSHPSYSAHLSTHGRLASVPPKCSAGRKPIKH